MADPHQGFVQNILSFILQTLIKSHSGQTQTLRQEPEASKMNKVLSIESGNANRVPGGVESWADLLLQGKLPGVLLRGKATQLMPVNLFLKGHGKWEGRIQHQSRNTQEKNRESISFQPSGAEGPHDRQ